MASSLYSSAASFAKKLGLTRSSAVWKLLAAIFALLNLRHLPFGWHIRVFHLFSVYPKLPPIDERPASIFRPMILKSRVTPYEVDYNIHKSNSTYFTDFDMARSQLVTWLAINGMRKVAAELNVANKTKGVIGIHLGSVMCNFKREIKPFEKFEIWSRVLTWDRKWAYVVSHWVKAGSIKPKAYTLQPWKNRNKTRISEIEDDDKANASPDSTSKERKQPVVFATALAKGVFKKGRLTVSPERIWEASGLLPPRPKELHQPASGTPSPDPIGKVSENTKAEDVPDITTSSTLEKITSKEEAEAAIEATLGSPEDQKGWDWKRVEEERLKGLELANAFHALEAISGTVPGDEEIVLGSYTDIL